MILSLALISFVFLLVITLVSQVRQDLAYSDARQNHILAKAHARMGMMIAIPHTCQGSCPHGHDDCHW